MYERGCIALIPFPFSDLSTTKRRPVLMLTSPDSRGDFLAMPITSKHPIGPSIAINAGPLEVAGSIPLDSWIKTNSAFSLSTSLLVKSIGQISEKQRLNCVDQLCKHLRQP